jgi:hypothetical protein
MLPPIGFIAGPAKMPESGDDTTWFVITTATPNWSAMRESARRNLEVDGWRGRRASDLNSETNVRGRVERGERGRAREVPAARDCARQNALGKLLLALGELAAAGVVRAVQRGRAVDDEERVARLGHHRAGVHEELGLVLRVVGAGEGDVLQDVVRVHPVARRDRLEPLRAKAALRVDVQRLAFSAAAVERKLARHAKRVAHLRLPGAELAVNLGDRARLHAT